MHDETSQLTSAAYESGHPLHTAGESYQFDSNGNRTMDGYYTGRDNQLLADGEYRYAFDAEGHTTGRTDTATGEHTEYAWDHRGRLASVSVYEDETKADLVSRVCPPFRNPCLLRA